MILELLSRVKIYEQDETIDESFIDNKINSYNNKLVKEYANMLIESGIPEYFVKKYVNYGKLEMNDMHKLIKTLEKKH